MQLLKLGSLILSLLAFSKANEEMSTEAKYPEIDSPNRQGITFIGSVDGKSFYSQDTRMAWSQCMDFCHFVGMKMARVTSSAQKSLLSAFLQTGQFKNIAFFYMSGTDHVEEGTWRWLLTGEPVLYTNWASGHPRVDDKAWNCHAMNMNGAWQNQNCGDLEPNRYILGPLCEL